MNLQPQTLTCPICKADCKSNLRPNQTVYKCQDCTRTVRILPASMLETLVDKPKKTRKKKVQ